MIENLRAKLVAERRRNVVQEMEIRKEMGDAMIQQILESEELRRWDGGSCWGFLMYIYQYVGTVADTFSIRCVVPAGRSRS